MSSKKRKVTSPWSSCDYCNVIIAQKDSAVHKESCCPPNFQNWVHPFIYLECLYATLEVFSLEDKSLSLIPKELKNDIVLMPCHVLQLCKIPVGDPVLVKTSGCDKTAKIVKIAWPIQEKTSGFSLSFSCEVADLYNLDLGSQIIVSKIQDEIPTANSITIFCENDLSSSDVRNLLIGLQRQSNNKIFCVGNKLLIKNYGTKIIFKIIEMNSSQEGEEEGETMLESGFFLVTSKTMWKLGNNERKMPKSKNLISKLGGLNSAITELRDVISLAFTRENFLTGIHVTRGVLIYGPAGTGKTTLIEALSEEFTSNIIRIECAKIVSKFLGETERELQNLFEKAKQTSPSIILIDDLDILCYKSNSTSEFEKRITATLSTELDKLNKRLDTAVIVLGTTSKINQIDQMLRCPTRFGKEIEIHVPGPTERFQILKVLLVDINHGLTDNDLENLSDSLHGFVGADIISLVSKAVLKNYKTSEGKEKVSMQDFLWALNKVKPSAMKEVMIDVPNVRWEDIGGQEVLKLKLRQCVEWPLKYRNSFSKLGLTPPKGVLMFGPPGCSKTMIAKALATESQLNFISVKGPELFSKWVGESEGAVRRVFKRARETAPTIIFFDELDAIGSERNNAGGSNVQERVLAQLLTELDGVESLDNVTVIAATNRLDRIDPALIRPGRLDRIIYVPLPDSKTREDIFRLQLKKTLVGDDVVLDELVEKTEGYSAAEIVAVSREAALKALEENLNAEIVQRKHFLNAFSIVLPRTPKNLLELYDKYLLK